MPLTSAYVPTPFLPPHSPCASRSVSSSGTVTPLEPKLIPASPDFVGPSSLSPLERESLAHDTLHGGALGISRRVQRDETEILAGTLQQSAAIVELAAAVEEECRVLRERSDGNDIGVVDGVARELPHRSTRPRRLAPVRDLLRLRGGGCHGAAGRKHRRAHGRRDRVQMSSDGELCARHRQDSSYELTASFANSVIVPLNRTSEVCVIAIATRFRVGSLNQKVP